MAKNPRTSKDSKKPKSKRESGKESSETKVQDSKIIRRHVSSKDKSFEERAQWVKTWG